MIKIISGDQSLILVLSWSNHWQGVGLMGLNSRNFGLLQQFREQIPETILGEYEFISVPRAAINSSSSEVSSMLRGDLKTIMLANLPALLFLRKPGLRGNVKVTSTKTFTEKDHTKKGQSMVSWRLMELTGDLPFYDSLASHEEDHQFKLNGKTVLIKGVTRRAGMSQRAGPAGNPKPPQGNTN